MLLSMNCLVLSRFPRTWNFLKGKVPWYVTLFALFYAVTLSRLFSSSSFESLIADTSGGAGMIGSNFW